MQKQSVHVQNVPIYYYKPSKKYSSRDTISLSLMKNKLISTWFEIPRYADERKDTPDDDKKYMQPAVAH
jgi:hypothetical protein